jgi:hypothetical protein
MKAHRNSIVHMPLSLYQGDSVTASRDKYLKERINEFEDVLANKAGITKNGKIRNLIKEKEEELRKFNRYCG